MDRISGLKATTGKNMKREKGRKRSLKIAGSTRMLSSYLSCSLSSSHYLPITTRAFPIRPATKMKPNRITTDVMMNLSVASSKSDGGSSRSVRFWLHMLKSRYSVVFWQTEYIFSICTNEIYLNLIRMIYC